MKRLLRARPHLLAACLCVGLAGANLARDASLMVVLSGLGLVAVAAALPLGVEAACARGRTCARRVVVGERAARRARSERSAPSGRDSRARDRCRDRAGSALAVRRPRAGADAALRHGRDSRAGAAPTSTGPLASAGSNPRRDRRDPAASRAEGRLRRANVAAPSRRARRRARGPAGESSVDEAACRASRTGCAHICPQGWLQDCTASGAQ